MGERFGAAPYVSNFMTLKDANLHKFSAEHTSTSSLLVRRVQTQGR
jgi:hypothetical protein